MGLKWDIHGNLQWFNGISWDIHGIIDVFFLWFNGRLIGC
jgi:hypothetical protein